MNDPNDISLWKLGRGNKPLAQVLTCLPQVKSKKVVHFALNGSAHLQQVGLGSTILDLTVFVESQEQVLAIDALNADGDILQVYYRGVTYSGFIEDEMPEWEPPINDGEHYKGTMTFVVLTTTPDRS